MRRETGFSLIEILVAILILSLVALSIMALLPKGHWQVTEAGRLSTISHLANQKIDYLKTLNSTHFDLTAGIHPTNPALYRIQSPPYPTELNGYSIRWTVSPDSPTTGVTTVLVEVGYMIFDTSGNSLTNNQQFQIKEFFTTYLRN